MTYFTKDFREFDVIAYGVTQRIEQLAMRPITGLRTAALAIVGLNNRTGKYDRVNETIRTTLKAGVSLTFFSAAAIFIIMSHRI